MSAAPSSALRDQVELHRLTVEVRRLHAELAEANARADHANQLATNVNQHIREILNTALGQEDDGVTPLRDTAIAVAHLVDNLRTDLAITQGQRDTALEELHANQDWQNAITNRMPEHYDSDEAQTAIIDRWLDDITEVLAAAQALRALQRRDVIDRAMTVKEVLARADEFRPVRKAFEARVDAYDRWESEADRG